MEGGGNRGARQATAEKTLQRVKLHRSSIDRRHVNKKVVREVNWAKQARSPSTCTSQRSSRAFETPKRSTRRGFGDVGDSPDTVHDIIWDPASPTPAPLVSAKGQGKTGVKISELVNKIAPEDGNLGIRDPSLLWIGEGPIECTPEPAVPRTRRKSARQSDVEDLRKLAREFDLRISKEQQESGHREQSGQTVDLDRELNALFDSSTQHVSRGLSQTSSTASQEARDCQTPTAAENRQHPGAMGSREASSSVPAHGQAAESSESVAAKLGFDDDWDNDDLLNDSFVLEMTQNPTGPQMAPATPAIVNTSTVNTTIKTNAAKASISAAATTSMSAVSTSTTHTVSPSYTTSSNSPTSIPVSARASKPISSSSSTKAISPSSSSSSAMSTRATSTNISVHSRLTNSKRASHTLKVNPSTLACTAAHGQPGPSKSRHFWEGSEGMSLKQSTFMGYTMTSMPLQKPSPGLRHRGTPTHSHTPPSVSHQSPQTMGAAPHIKQTAGTNSVSGVGGRAQTVPDKDLTNQMYVWNDQDEEDDSLLYQVCDVVERLSASQEERKAAGSQPTEIRPGPGHTTLPSLSACRAHTAVSGNGSWPPAQIPTATTSHRPASHGFSRSLSAPNNHSGASSSSSINARVQNSAPSTFKGHSTASKFSLSAGGLNQSKFPQLRNPAGCAQGPSNTTTTTCHARGLNGPTHTNPSAQHPASKRHLYEPRPLANKVFVPNQMPVKCSAAEIERKKQEAIARRKMRLEASQKHAPPAPRC